MFLIVMLPTFAASVFLLVGMRNIIRDKSFETAESKVESYGYWVNEIMLLGDQTAKNVAANKTIIDFITAEHDDNSDYYRFYAENKIEDLVSTPSQAENVYIYVNRRDFLYNEEFRRLDEEIKYAPWYESAMAGSSPVWNVLVDPVTEKYRLTCTCPIYSGEENIGAAIVTFSDEWTENVSIDSSASLILALDGRVYCSSNAPNIKAGDDLSDYAEYSDGETGFVTYDKALYGIKGYGVTRNLKNTGGVYQIALVLPDSTISYELDKMSVIYGSYCGLMVVLSLLTILLFTNTFSSRIKNLSEKMHKVADGDFSVTFNDNGSDEISQLYGDLSLMISNMQKLINDNYATKLQSEAFKLNQMEAEFKALSSQINPHFLYNTLETIRMKAYVNNDKETAALVKKLGKFMRRCLEFKDGEVTLQSELEFTKSYLELQGARFGDRITYHIYSEVSGDYMILPLLIQPLVENAFVHGVEASKGGGKIDIKVYYHNDFVYVDVTDNGQGMNDEKLAELEYKLEVSDTSSGKSIGLTNVHKRIRMYHGDQYGMRIESEEGKGTTIRLVLPRAPKSGLAVNELPKG
ncbi:MAG: sensor histidine kinase [Oscillospiraceae bacterium]|nr:sensor histidine kinase [Oscillospiraceae bacterium]